VSRAKSTLPADWSVADLLVYLGHISPQRIRLQPPPGKATERDVIALRDREERLYELVEGVLVEKVMGYTESQLALWLGHLIQLFLDQHNLGELAGADGALRLLPGLVRIPDLSFISAARVPSPEVLDKPIPELAPDLAVEVLSAGNTEEEMKRKVKDYFFSGVRLVWLVDPARRVVQVYTAPDQVVTLTERQTLDGGAVLPGFKLPLTQLFARLDRPKSPRSGKRKQKP
jgi:Uma2 family endonuclease